MNSVFYLSAAVAIVSTVLMITRLNAVHALLYLILSLLSVAVIFFISGAPFAAGLELIIYAGAIMVLFTFVIMLLNAGKEERTHGSRAAYIVGIPGVAVLVSLLAFIFLSARSHLAQARLGDYIVSTSDLSKVLFRDLLLPFEVTSVLILIAILGAVALASKEH